MQRSTGRIYLGPLDASAIGEAAGSGQCIFNELFRQDVLAASYRLRNDAFVESGAIWSVWSRTDAVVRQISHCVMDNSPDTIRSRKIGYTIRTRDDLGGSE